MQGKISDPAVEFFKKLKNKDYVSESLDSFNSTGDKKTVSVNSDHAAYRFLRGLKSESKKPAVKKNNMLENKIQCFCGRKINKPSGGCSVMCSCGKVHN